VSSIQKLLSDFIHSGQTLIKQMEPAKPFLRGAKSFINLFFSGDDHKYDLNWKYPIVRAGTGLDFIHRFL
jgi:hypothetical protein